MENDTFNTTIDETINSNIMPVSSPSGTPNPDNYIIKVPTSQENEKIDVVQDPTAPNDAVDMDISSQQQDVVE